MKINKTEILKNICYTELVYGRINKKLKSNFSNAKIEKLIFETIKETEITNFEKIGKNFYISNLDKSIKITVNSNTFRIITANKIEKCQTDLKLLELPLEPQIKTINRKKI